MAEQILCIDCGRPALERCTTAAGRREVAISKLCEPCWMAWVDEEPDEDDEELEEQ